MSISVQVRHFTRAGAISWHRERLGVERATELSKKVEIWKATLGERGTPRGEVILEEEPFLTAPRNPLWRTQTLHCVA